MHKVWHCRDTGFDMAEVKLAGSRIGPGLALGTAWLVDDFPEWRHVVRKIEQAEVEAELRRIHVALDLTRTELQASARRVEEQFSAELGQIFRAHEIMLEGILS